MTLKQHKLTVTPEMIEVGVEAYTHGLGVYTIAEIVRDIYLAMHQASIPINEEATEENASDLSRSEPKPDDLLLRSQVVELCKRKADDLAGLVLEAAEAGFPKSAREQEAMEATATKLRYAIAQMPAATALEQSQKRERELVEALAFYADPENYHAISFLADRPAGGFADDFGDDHGHEDYDRPMPGKLARDTLRSIDRVSNDQG